MSKVKVKFIYGGQRTVAVNETHKGPVDLSNLADSLNTSPKKQANQEQKIVSTADPKQSFILSSPVKEKQNDEKIVLNTYKSAETLPSVRKSSQEQSNKKMPILNIQDANQKDFNKSKDIEAESPIKADPESKINQQPSIKAPSYKIPPKAGSQNKREYIKGQNVEKYLYNGLPEQQEDQFVGCFGCMRKKPKAYSVQKGK